MTDDNAIILDENIRRPFFVLTKKYNFVVAIRCEVFAKIQIVLDNCSERIKYAQFLFSGQP